MTLKDKLYIFDISNMIHRAFHAFAKHDLKAANGLPTGAIYGTFNMLLSFILKNEPQNILICYDAQTATSIRKEIYPEYKANRVQVNAVSAQELVIREIIRLLGMAGSELEGYEADDIIAAAVKKYKDSYDIEIITGDKDLLQLASETVSIYDQMKNTYYGDAEVLKKFGVRANQISNYLALVGDKSDNIPGVLGIGPVAARSLLKAYEDVHDIYRHLDELDPKYFSKLHQSSDIALTSLKLATLYDDIDIGVDDVSFKPMRSERLLELLGQLDFDRSLSKLDKVWDLY